MEDSKIKPINYGTRANMTRVAVCQKCDALWERLFSLRSLASKEATEIISELNRLEYITK